MGVVPSGQFSLHEGADRLDLTIAGVLFGQYRFAFDRRLAIFERDGRTVCALDQISGVEVQATGVAPGRFSFMLVVAHPGGVEHLYLNEPKAKVAELAARIATFVGVQVTFREQPFQRQVREAIGDVLPDALRSPSPTRLPRSVQGAITLGRAFSQAFAGLMLIFMSGLVVLSAPSQSGMLAIGGVLGVLGLVLLGHGAFRATQTVKGGAFERDPAGAASSSKVAEAARFALATGTSRGSMGLFDLVGRTDLVFGLVFFAVGAAAMALTVTTQGTGSATAGFLVGLLFAAIGGFLAWQSIAKIRIWRAIQASPVAVEAIVHEIRQVNRRPLRFALDYRYQDPAGAFHSGRSFPLTPAEADPWRRLDVAAIVVNRDRPEQSMLAELRPIRHSTREERYPDGEVKRPTIWPGAGPSPE